MKKSTPFLEMIRNKARRLKKFKGLTHCQSLEEAAKEAGFDSYNHIISLTKTDGKHTK